MNGPANDYFVPLGDHLLDGNKDIRESMTILVDNFLEFLRATSMKLIVGSYSLIENGRISLPEFLIPTTRNGFVVFS